MRTLQAISKNTSSENPFRTPACPEPTPGGGRSSFPLFGLPFLALLAALSLGGCSIVATRPVQLMNDTAAALRAAKEVQADSLAPELYRQSTESFLKARNEYRFKNFELARRHAIRARRLAEQAEFEALRNGAQRKSIDEPSDPLAGSENLNLRSASESEPSHPPYDYPKEEPTIYGSPSQGQSSPAGGPPPQAP